MSIYYIKYEYLSIPQYRIGDWFAYIEDVPHSITAINALMGYSFKKIRLPDAKAEGSDPRYWINTTRKWRLPSKARILSTLEYEEGTHAIGKSATYQMSRRTYRPYTLREVQVLKSNTEGVE